MISTAENKEIIYLSYSRYKSMAISQTKQQHLLMETLNKSISKK